MAQHWRNHEHDGGKRDAHVVSRVLGEPCDEGHHLGEWGVEGRRIARDCPSARTGSLHLTYPAQQLLACRQACEVGDAVRCRRADLRLRVLRGNNSRVAAVGR